MTAPSEKRPEALRADIEQTRTQLSETLQAIQHKLSPGRLLDEALDRLGGKATAATTDYLDAVLPQNPLPVVLIGVGMGWLTLSYFDSVHSPGAAGQGYAAEVRRREQQQPLWLAGLGLVAGAALGSLLPSTRPEDRWLGEYRDRLVEQAQAAGIEYRDKAQSVVAAARKAAETEIHQLAEQDDKASLYGAARRITDIPKAALEAAVEEARQQGLVMQGIAGKVS